MFDQIVNNPASLLLIFVISIIAWLVETLPSINSKLVPHVCVGLGAAIYWLFVSPSTVPQSFPHPAAVLVANGIICGFIAFILHGQIVLRLIKRFSPSQTDAPPKP